LSLIRSDRSVLPGNFELDILFPDQTLAVEFNGIYWHSEATGTSPDYHATKSSAARAAGIQLIHVWEDDWRDRRVLVLRSLLTKLGVLEAAAAADPQLAPFTRHVAPTGCTVAPVDRPTAAAFLTANHLQGATSTTGSTSLGLRDATGTLVALLSASISGERATIERYATSCIIPGGLARLEAALVAELPASVSRLVTYADDSLSDSGLYENSGWVNDGVIRPDYSYIVRDTRVHKFNYRLKRFREDEALEYREGLSERELAALNGLNRIWDAGKTRWVKPVSVPAVAQTEPPSTPDALDLAA